MDRARRTFVATGLVALLAVAGVTAAIAADPAPAPPPKIAFLANGIVPADALAAGPIAGQLGAPVYTTRQETLSPGTADALTAYNPELVIVMGGPVAISDTVVTQVADATGLPAVDPTPTPATGVVRAAGGDRFETATIVADLLAAYSPAYLPVDLQAVDADLLDGKDSGDFLGKTEKAADSDLLDGMDSTEFATPPTVVRTTVSVAGGTDNGINTFADCPAGTRVLGGGVGADNGGASDDRVIFSGPTDSSHNFTATTTGDVPTAWAGRYRNGSGGAIDVYVWAICG